MESETGTKEGKYVVAHRSDGAWKNAGCEPGGAAMARWRGRARLPSGWRRKRRRAKQIRSGVRRAAARWRGVESDAAADCERRRPTEVWKREQGWKLAAGGERGGERRQAFILGSDGIRRRVYQCDAEARSAGSIRSNHLHLCLDRQQQNKQRKTRRRPSILSRSMTLMRLGGWHW